VDVLGETMGLRHRTWFPNVKVKGGEYGNAIISRFPILATENIDVTRGWRKRRSVLHARFRVRSPRGRKTRTVHVFNMHLGLAESERRWQLERFLDSHPFAGLHQRTPIIVAGDFNDVYGTLGARLLEPAGFAGLKHPLRTFPAYAPLRALDCVYVRGDLRMENAFRSKLRVARQASDHLPIVADLRLVPP
jgi:endonuclease/exonuclease/phosphatase family metal-dependent hydrolase